MLIKKGDKEISIPNLAVYAGIAALEGIVYNLCVIAKSAIESKKK